MTNNNEAPQHNRAVEATSVSGKVALLNQDSRWKKGTKPPFAKWRVRAATFAKESLGVTCD